MLENVQSYQACLPRIAFKQSSILYVPVCNWPVLIVNEDLQN